MSIERFLAKIQFEEEEQGFGCWVWVGARDSNGYGQFSFPGIKTGMAHRIAYILVYGSIPEGKELHHRCRVRACVCPWHLKPLTRAEHEVIEPPPEWVLKIRARRNTVKSTM